MKALNGVKSLKRLQPVVVVALLEEKGEVIEIALHYTRDFTPCISSVGTRHRSFRFCRVFHETLSYLGGKSQSK